MRVFKEESIYDKNTEKWVDYWSIDNIPVDSETYFQEVEKEESCILNNEHVEDCACPDCCAQRELEAMEVEEYLEEPNEECNCPDCVENRKMEYLAEAVKHMFENELCPQCVFEMLQDIYDKAYADGYEECKEEMELEDDCDCSCDEQMNITINIDNLSGDSSNAMDFVEQLKELSRRTSINV